MTHIKILSLALLVIVCGAIAQRCGYAFIDGVITSFVLGYVYAVLYIALDRTNDFTA